MRVRLRDLELEVSLSRVAAPVLRYTLCERRTSIANFVLLSADPSLQLSTAFDFSLLLSTDVTFDPPLELSTAFDFSLHFSANTTFDPPLELSTAFDFSLLLSADTTFDPPLELSTTFDFSLLLSADATFDPPLELSTAFNFSLLLSTDATFDPPLLSTAFDAPLLLSTLQVRPMGTNFGLGSRITSSPFKPDLPLASLVEVSSDDGFVFLAEVSVAFFSPALGSEPSTGVLLDDPIAEGRAGP